MFSYYTVYRVASPSFPRSLVRGAAQLDDHSWVFFTDPEDDKPVCEVTFSKLGQRQGSIVGVTQQQDKAVFTPVTLEELKEAPARFGLSPEEGAALQRDSDIYTFLVAAQVPEWYVEQYGPPEEQAELEEEVSLALVALEEARGVTAKPGTIHRWSDGRGETHDYEKQHDGSWRRVDTEWSDSHPDIPKNTRDKYFDKNEGWDAQRLATHERLLKEVRGTAFEGKKPVPQDESPEFTYIMGPPAAGKSTRQNQKEYDNIVKLDPDEFVERMPEFQRAKEVKARNGAQAVVDEALMLNDKLIDEAKEGRFNFLVSGTGANLSWMEKHLFPDLKRRNYRINVVMTYVDDLDELMLRTEARGHVRGRFVPPERTMLLHEVLPKNFKELMKNSDVTTLALLNSHQSEGSSVARNDFVYQQAGDHKSILDKNFFDDFMEKTKEKESKKEKTDGG